MRPSRQRWNLTLFAPPKRLPGVFPQDRQWIGNGNDHRMKDRLHVALLWLWKRLPLPRWGRWAVLALLNTKFLVGVVGIVFDEQERFLLLHHTYRQRYQWGLPGGWVSGSERLEHALQRELREETGYEIAVGEVFHVRSGYPRPQLDIYFLCTYRDGDFRPNAEVDAARFCTLDDLPAALLPNQRPLIELALARKRAREHNETKGTQ